MTTPEPATAAPFVPRTRSLRVLAAAARQCAGCPLFRAATQTVFGTGPRDAHIVLVGEQPGDREDLAGEPFVGPAGRVLEIEINGRSVPVLAEQLHGDDRQQAWEQITNANPRIAKYQTKTDRVIPVIRLAATDA